MVFKKSIQKESTQKIQWKCVESSIESKCLNYGRFILSPLKKGQADTIGIAMRRALLGEIKGTSITRAKFEKVEIFHEYSRIVGIEEPVHEILLNLKQVVLRSFTNRIIKASICVNGPICVTAKYINLPSSVQIIDTGQYLFTLTEPIDFSIELQIERGRGYNMKKTSNPQNQDGSYSIDGVSMPVRNVNYTIHNFGNENEDEEMLFLEIWTNGSLTPREALREASMNLIGLFSPFLHSEEEDIHLEEKENTCTLPSFIFTFKDKASELNIEASEFKLLELIELQKKQKGIIIPWDCVFIDQLGFSSRIYNCLKKSNLNTVKDILEDFSFNSPKMANLGREGLKEIALKLMEVVDVLITLYRGLDNK